MFNDGTVRTAMNVAVLMLNRGRGSGVVARQHARALLARGHNVTLVYPGAERGGRFDEVDVELSGSTLPVHEYLPDAPGRQQQVSQMDAATVEAHVADYERALLEGATEADVIVCHHGNLTAPVAQRVADALSIPFVVFVHGTGIEPRLHGGYADEVWSRIDAALLEADGIIVTTEYVRDSLLRPLVDVPDDRLLIVPCGIDVDEYHPGRDGAVLDRFGVPELFVICPGAVTELKGTHNVVAATEHYADLAPTIFIGDGDLRPRLVDELGDRGTFLGWVHDADKSALIRSATVLVAGPQKQEHFGIIYVEALACGTVPVAYEGGGVGSIITPEVGVLTDRTPEALGRATRAVLSDDGVRAAMAVAGRTRAEQLFDERALGRRVVDWLEGIVAR